VRTNATSEAQTPSTSSAGADVSQPEPPQPENKKLRLLENLDSEPEDEPVDSSGNDDIHNLLKEIAAYLSSTRSSCARMKIISHSLLETSL